MNLTNVFLHTTYVVLYYFLILEIVIDFLYIWYSNLTNIYTIEYISPLHVADSHLFFVLILQMCIKLR